MNKNLKVFLAIIMSVVIFFICLYMFVGIADYLIEWANPSNKYLFTFRDYIGFKYSIPFLLSLGIAYLIYQLLTI